MDGGCATRTWKPYQFVMVILANKKSILGKGFFLEIEVFGKTDPYLADIFAENRTHVLGYLVKKWANRALHFIPVCLMWVPLGLISMFWKCSLSCYGNSMLPIVIFVSNLVNVLWCNLPYYLWWNRYNKILKKTMFFEYEVGVFVLTLCLILLYNQGTFHH